VSEKKSARIRIKWVRSGIGFPYRHKEVVRSLGLRRLNQTFECEDTPQIRGMIAKVSHLVEIVERHPEHRSLKTAEYLIIPPQAGSPEEASRQESQTQAE
jgi:large subunit ribosomal protein L30